MGSEPRNRRDEARKIALLCQHFFPELISTGMHMTELACALRSLGWFIQVYCAQPSISIEEQNAQVPEEMEYRGIRILRVRALGSHRKNLLGRLVHGMSYLLSVAWAVFRDSGEMGGYLITTNPSILGAVGRCVGWFRRRPYIVIVYDVYPDVAVRLNLFKARSLFVRLWEMVVRFGLRGASGIVVIGRDMEKLVRQKLRVGAGPPVYLIPNWSDETNVSLLPHEASEFRRRHVPDGYFVVQYSGNMALTHNIEPLIEAAEILRNEKVLFQFIGEGSKKKRLQEMARDVGLQNVQFFPYQPLSELGQVLSAADASVVCLESCFTGVSVPSKTYGIMASGRPILGLVDPESEIGRTIIENGCGLVMPDPSGSEVADAIRGLLREPANTQRMGQNGYRAFLGKYTLTMAANRYSEVMGEAFDRACKKVSEIDVSAQVGK